MKAGTKVTLPLAPVISAGGVGGGGMGSTLGLAISRRPGCWGVLALRHHIYPELVLRREEQHLVMGLFQGDSHGNGEWELLSALV